MKPPMKIGVIGGGTAGLLTALTLRRWLPQHPVTIVASRQIPIVGVGEATTPPMVPFLHYILGIDPHAFYREVHPTWKLGIRFDWGPQESGGFNYPFTTPEVTTPQFREALTHSKDLDLSTFTSLLMHGARAPLFLDGMKPRSLLPRVRHAYHLDNSAFVAFLRARAEAEGVVFVDAVIDDVETTGAAAPEISRLQTTAGPLSFDFYVDCSGFRALLMKALATPFIDYQSSLFCDTAIVAEVPLPGVIPPFTRAETMAHGWCWSIPTERSDHRGYVFDSSSCSVDEALAEMRAANPGLGEPWVVRFRSGRRRDFVVGGGCVAGIGNAYGFVEPLESTALHMVLTQIVTLVRLLSHPADVTNVNTGIGEHWDFLRWFLAIHYRYNGAQNSAFWRRCRSEVDVSGLQWAIDDFQSRGPFTGRAELGEIGDRVFGAEGVDFLLLGQGVSHPPLQPESSREDWLQLLARQRGIVTRSYDQRTALELMREQPEFLSQLISSPRSWCHQYGKSIETLLATPLHQAATGPGLSGATGFGP